MRVRRHGPRRWVAVGLSASLVLGACSGDGDRSGEGEPNPTSTSAPAVATRNSPEVVTTGQPDRPAARPVGLRLSEGTAAAEPVEATAVVDGAALTDEESEALIARLPPWDLPPDDRRTFNRPADSLAPPLIGDTVDTPFPPGPDDDVVDAADEPLEVLRYQPDGAVDVAPFLSVTFNQPMVPLATVDQLDTADVPVVVTPAVAGRWRWIGTRTLRFEVVPGATDRLPAATVFTVEVPEGTESASGRRLAETVRWTFSTPAPRVTGFVGESDSLPLAPVFVAVFDQIVDPAAVLDTITVDADGASVPLRLAAAAEIDADEQARRSVADALDGRTVAFRPAGELPVGAAVTIAIGPGTPSTEGPLASTAAATYRSRTYGALDIARTDCGYGGPCVPGLPFVVEMTNPLDLEAFEASQITVEPAIPGLQVNVYGATIELSGATTGRTTYAVTISGSLADTFGQTLGDARTVRFEVGPAQPMLRGLQRDWITVDPFDDVPRVSVQTVNHDSVRVLAWAVTPADALAFRDYLERTWQTTEPAAPDWPQVLDEIVEIDGADDRFVETSIDLSDAFAGAGSQLVVRVEPAEPYAPDSEQYWNNRPTVAWVQSSTLAVDALHDHDELLVWTTDLLTGQPVGNVAIELLGDGRVARTDDDGLVRVPLADEGITGIWANAGDRTAFLPSDWYTPLQRQNVTDEGRWYVFDDRGIYRPGETARITGWVRRLDWSDDASLELYDEGLDVEYRATDPQGVELTTGSVPINALGGFNLTVELPAGANLGQAWLELTLRGRPGGAALAATQHTFQVQEFRRPEFEVTARQESTGPFVASEPVTVAVDAEYFAGGGLADADVDWLVTTAPTTYRPPNWDAYQFGVWQPWWWFEDVGADRAADVGVASDCFDCPPGTEAEYEEFAGRTDVGGTHYLQIELDDPEVDLPSTVTAEATVFDVNRQAWASRTDLLVHPASYYVGVRSDRTFVEQGTPIRYDAVVTDIEGEPVAGRELEVTAGRVEWTYTDGVWGEEVVDVQTCAITSSADPTDGTMRCEFSTEVGGTYRVLAVVTDDSGRRNRTETTQWVTGASGRPMRDVAQETVTIVPDRETYAVGDTAELLVQSPFAPANGLMTITHHGIVRTEAFVATDGSAVLQVPIDDDAVPGLRIQVDMVGVAQRSADDGSPLPDGEPRPAYATSQIELAVPPLTRALTVTAAPADDAVEPGDDTSVTVSVIGPDGEPAAGAEVALVVVDEAVLALTGYTLIDPLEVFYGPLWTNLTSRYSRSSILLTRADLLGGGTDQGSDGGGEATAEDTAEPDTSTGGAAPSTTAPAAVTDEEAARTAGQDVGAIELREDFEALAVYAPGQVTGVDGTVTVDVPLPDSLTRYRVMAVAVDGADRFGKGESTITARLPLMVRPSPPRFLNYGDRFELPVVLQNQTDDAIEVDVAVEASNLTLARSTGGAVGTRVTVPANERIEVRFPIAADDVGTARLRVVASGGGFSDAASVALPVYTPATAEAFATYGVIDEPGRAIGQPLLAPTGVIPEFGGLEINTSSTALQALTDAVIYLTDYPFGTPDGHSSRILAIASLRDVLDAFDAEGVPSPEELDEQVAADIAGLAALQNDDGGWGWWTQGLESVPWQSLQAAHALVVARAAGYSVRNGTYDRAIAHLADIESFIPADYPDDVRLTLRAYAIHVRALAGDRDVAKATSIYRDGGIALQLDAAAWLWPAIDDADLRAEIEALFMTRATETAGAATFATSYSEDAYVIAASDRRSDGVILHALITESPQSDLIPKVVAGLLGHQTRGRWNSAQDNAFILVALDRYFDSFESVTPDLVARAWLGDTYVSEQAFSGRTTDRATTVVPMSELVGVPDGTNLVLQKEGEGRLYYRLGVRSAPADLTLGARDEGFVVERTYEAVDDPADVTRDADGTWRIRAGADVRVTVTMVADARRTHVALVDPLPAGLEAVNPALAVSQTFRPEEPAGDDGGDVRPLDDWFCWCWNWFEHQNLRDDRVEAFTSYLEGGTYDYTYVARATTPGEFVVPPARAEEIYAPEIFGRSASDTVVIS